MRTQFNAWPSGAISGSGKDGWCRSINNRDVTANINVSRFSRALSLVRRMSAAENRLKMSSDDSGSSQNYKDISALESHQKGSLH
jgi:hypothetical protein